MELICYVREHWAPRIRPAGAQRAWMDQTAERFAYRCLPLVIASAHGWEILSACGFEARWRGGLDTDAVEIRVDPGTEPRLAPVSLFGQATITFHVEGVFRTPPGWNLWVSGPPNEAKDGIAALSGIVETDWSPYTFTMNWRFTRRDHWVRFEENEPIAFLFPIQRGAIESFETKVRPMAEEEGLEEQYAKWSVDRLAFQAQVARNRPAAPADNWQKLYYRGLDAYENPGAADHRTKLRPRPFQGPDGSPLAVGDARRCPADGGRAAPAASPPPAGAAPRLSLQAPVLGGFATPKRPGGS